MDLDASSTHSDLDLLAALQAGEDAAFETLVRRYGGRMLSVAKRFLSNESDAQDAVQEAFLNAFKSLANFDGRSELGTWLHRIVVNACLMKLRTKKRHPEQSIDELLPTYKADGHQAAPCQRWSAPPSVEMERVETQRLIREHINQLPETYRTVLLLRDIEEFDTEAVAQMLELNPGAVKVRLHRARQALRTLLDPLFGGKP